MRLAIMQPYFFPYLGYFQLLNAADKFVVYDNIQYSKGGWVNRNRILSNSQAAYFTITLKKESDYLDIRDRHISPDWAEGRRKTLGRISEAYRKAPSFDSVYSLIESCFMHEDDNLFGYIHNSLMRISEFLDIKTPIIVSSTVDTDHTLKSADRVIAMCRSMKADRYLNPEGGMILYEKDKFLEAGIDLQFLKSSGVNYRQFSSEFIPSLSVIDVMMFNPKDRVRELIDTAYELI